MIHVCLSLCHSLSLSLSLSFFLSLHEPVSLPTSLSLLLPLSPSPLPHSLIPIQVKVHRDMVNSRPTGTITTLQPPPVSKQAVKIQAPPPSKPATAQALVESGGTTYFYSSDQQVHCTVAPPPGSTQFSGCICICGSGVCVSVCMLITQMQNLTIKISANGYNMCISVCVKFHT